MTPWSDDLDEFDEMGEQYPEEIPDEYLRNQDRQLSVFKEMDILDEWWTEPIKDTEHPQIREKN